MRTRLLAVVILTSSSEPEDLILSHSTGANGHVRKPSSRSEFSTSVNTLDLFWSQVNEIPSAPALQ
jgi:hypothetical protein